MEQQRWSSKDTIALSSVLITLGFAALGVILTVKWLIGLVL